MAIENMKTKLTQEQLLEKAHKRSEIWSTIAIVGLIIMAITALLFCFFGENEVVEDMLTAVLFVDGIVTLCAFCQFKDASYIIHKDFVERIANGLLDDSEKDCLGQTNSRSRAPGERKLAPPVCGGSGSGKKHYYISPDESAIIRFLLGEPVVVNEKPMDINTIWKYNYTQLEERHDYIQWLFPLADASDYNPNAPVLTLRDLEIITEHPAIRERLLRSLELMLDFYGFSLDWKTKTVSQTDPKAWPPTYHNYLRITRILKSLTICGLNEYAVAFYNALLSIPDIKNDVPQTSLDYWKDAIYINNFESEES